MLKQIMLELIGAFLITFVMAFCRINNPADYLLIGTTYFLVTASLSYAFKTFTGGHFNPILSISLIFSNQISFMKAFAYVVVQIIGSLLAGLTVYAIYSPPGDQEISYYGEPKIKEDSKLVGGFLEFIAMFMLVYVYSAIICNIKAPKYIYGAAIGGVYSASLITMGTYSGGCINLITYIGPMVFSNYYDDLIYYTIAQLIGGLFSAIFYSIFLNKNVTEMDNDEEMEGETSIAKAKAI